LERQGKKKASQSKGRDAEVTKHSKVGPDHILSELATSEKECLPPIQRALYKIAARKIATNRSR